MSVNQVVLMGNVKDEPSMEYSGKGLAITKFRLETPGYGSRPADVHAIIAFGKGEGEDGLAAWCAQFLHAGTKVILQGRLSGQEFTPQSGKTFLTSQVVIFSIEALSNEGS